MSACVCVSVLAQNNQTVLYLSMTVSSLVCDVSCLRSHCTTAVCLSCVSVPSLFWHCWLSDVTSEEEGEAPCEVVLSGSQVLRTSCTMWLCFHLTLWRPLLTCGYSYKASCDIQALWCSALSISVSGCQNLQVTAFNPVRHRMLYTSTHMVTVDVKGLKAVSVTKPVDLLRTVTTLLPVKLCITI